MEEAKREAISFLSTYDDGNWLHVIKECENISPFDNTVSAFMSHCTACGGNWGGMFLSGIKKLWPSVWEAIPEKMGRKSFEAICNTLVLCGVDCSK